MAEFDVMPAFSIRPVVAAMSILVFGCNVGLAAEARGARRVPVIHCTDLFHPHVDPDDHFDLASVYAFPEFDLKGVVLDQGRQQLTQPGKMPVAQMNRITGRSVPAAIGLAEPLKNPHDKALAQSAEFQGGVELILRVLRESREKVRLSAVGSMRDVVAAYNREPGLFRKKVAMVLAFIGEASDQSFQEWNVKLDPQAYVGLMRSGLPVYWVPCFDGGAWQNKGHASFWRASHRALLADATPEATQFFIYALEKEMAEPLAFLSQPVDPVRQERLLAGTRNLWCTAVFGVMSGREVVWDGQRGRLTLPHSNHSGTGGGEKALFGFTEVSIRVSDPGVVSYGKGPGSHRVKRFEVLDAAHYEPGMVQATAELLGGLGKKAEP